MDLIIQKSNKIQNKQKDPSIELLRIIGTICVIDTHIKLKFQSFSNFYKTLFACFCADGVGIFWYIMGFFFFEKISYKKRLNNLFKKICIPLLFTIFFLFYFQNYNLKKKEFKIYLLNKTKKDYLNLLYNILTFDGGHLWFLYVYILIVILYPSFEGLNNKIEKYNIYSYKIFIIILIILIENDILYNKVLCINHHGLNGVIGAIPFIFCGNELKKNINKFKNKKIFSIFIIFFLGNNILRTYVINKTKKISLISWSTSFGIINNFILFIFVYSFDDILHYKILYFIITKIGSATFYIYLIHGFVINNIFKEYKIDKKFNKNTESIKGIMKYNIYSVLFIFSFSLFISFGILIIKNLIFTSKKILYKKIKNN